MTRFKREDIEQYYKVLGLDPNEEGLIYRDTINLPEIGELYRLNDFKSKLPYTAEELSKSYSLLVNMIHDDFWYNTQKRKDSAFQAAMDILDDLTKFNIEVEGNPEMTTARMHHLKTVILNGLCCAGDLVKFRMYQKNSSFDTIFKFVNALENEEKLSIDKEENTPKALKKLYYLILYSRFKDFGRDYELFDGAGDVRLYQVRYLVKRNVRENASLNDPYSDERVVGKPPVLRLNFNRKIDN